MTQVIAANIMNNLQELPAIDCEKDCSCDFEKIFDKTLTIGDMKGALLENTEAFANFKDILNQASSEVNVENSLDLTLSRDITEIISELKSAVEESKKDEDNAELAVIAVDSAPFQQVLTLNTASVEQEETLAVSQQIPFKQPAKTEKETLEELEIPLEEDVLQELNIESIDVQSGSSEDDASLMQNQSPQEQAVKLMIHSDVETFEVKLPDQPVKTTSKPVSVTPEKIIEQITKQMESLQNNSKLNIVLNPESLGKVNIQLINTKEGLSAQFTVSTQEARDLLMKGLDGLKDTLTAQGVGVDNVSVKINDTQKSEYNSDWTEQEGSRGGNKEQEQSQKDEKEKGLFEKMMSQQTEKK